MTASRLTKVPSSLQPNADDLSYDLEIALEAVVGIASRIPTGAFTAETLGTDRAGHGALIRSDGLVLTIGYLVAEAEEVWITLANGRVERGHVLAYDQESGFALLQVLARVDLPSFELGRSEDLSPGTDVILAGAGGRANSVHARVLSRQNFTGYWEYLVENAIFTAPAHPYWGGAALIGPNGQLLGVGSLQLLQEEPESNRGQEANMVVPIDLLRPIYDDLLTLGRRRTPPRPWLGLYAADIEGHVVIVGVSSRGPARKSNIKVGDVVVGVSGQLVRDAAQFFKAVWALGSAGAQADLMIQREGKRFEVSVKSADRSTYFAAPRLH